MPREPYAVVASHLIARQAAERSCTPADCTECTPADWLRMTRYRALAELLGCRAHHTGTLGPWRIPWQLWLSQTGS